VDPLYDGWVCVTALDDNVVDSFGEGIFTIVTIIDSKNAKQVWFHLDKVDVEGDKTKNYSN